VPHPSDWREYEFPLCAVAGVKGWRGFVGSVAGVASVEVEDGTSLCVVVHRREGSGFVPTSGSPVDLPPDASDETLGETLVEVLARGRVA
jgi:hypothetical protein